MNQPKTVARKKIICPDCKKPTLDNAMYSEDGASVFDQKCPACGVRHYEYISSHLQLGTTVDNSREWNKFREKYQTVDDPEDPVKLEQSEIPKE